MNNYQDVFDLVKKECTDDNGYESDQCYELIKELLKDRVCLSVDFYVDSLAHTGIIHHQPGTNRIILTPKGRDTVEPLV